MNDYYIKEIDGIKVFICNVCGVVGKIEETIAKKYCHKRSFAGHFAEGVKSNKDKRKSAFPNKVQVRSWNRKYGKQKADN